jgi:hypothetical protein
MYNVGKWMKLEIFLSFQNTLLCFFKNAWLVYDFSLEKKVKKKKININKCQVLQSRKFILSNYFLWNKLTTQNNDEFKLLK